VFRKILVANRGAIASRIFRTLRRMGVASAAVYSEADVSAPHVLAADEAVAIGAAPPAESYLRGDAVIAAARALGAEAIHPGYGFLAENADFAAACESAGLAFIGPTPEQMRAFGLKHTARALAAANRVPLLPGTDLLSGVADSPSIFNASDSLGARVEASARWNSANRGARIKSSRRRLHGLPTGCRVTEPLAIAMSVAKKRWRFRRSLPSLLRPCEPIQKARLPISAAPSKSASSDLPVTSRNPLKSNNLSGGPASSAE